jgi:hypothetical protein
MCFKKIRTKLRKRAFGNKVLFECHRLIYVLIESDDDEYRKKVQEQIGNHCFDVIAKKGPEEILDFRKILLKDVLQIVTSDNPLIAMRKQLIQEIHLDTINRLFFTERYYNRRQELYDILDKYESKLYKGNLDISSSDEESAILFMWSEARTCILRMLQGTYFEAGEDDWFSTYAKAYEILVKQTFDTFLSKKEEGHLVYAVLLEALGKQVDALQIQIVGEVIC